MEIQVAVADDEGSKREYVGLEVCRGPGVMRVLLTRPFGQAGRTVSLPLDQVQSVERVESTPLGEPIRPVAEEETRNAS